MFLEQKYDTLECSKHNDVSDVYQNQTIMIKNDIINGRNVRGTYGDLQGVLPKWAIAHKQISKIHDLL